MNTEIIPDCKFKEKGKMPLIDIRQMLRNNSTTFHLSIGIFVTPISVFLEELCIILNQRLINQHQIPNNGERDEFRSF